MSDDTITVTSYVMIKAQYEEDDVDDMQTQRDAQKALEERLERDWQPDNWDEFEMEVEVTYE